MLSSLFLSKPVPIGWASPDLRIIDPATGRIRELRGTGSWNTVFGLTNRELIYASFTQTLSMKEVMFNFMPLAVPLRPPDYSESRRDQGLFSKVDFT